MFDVITIGTATRDIFLTSPLFRVVKDPKHLRKIGFPTGEAQCFALGGKIEIGKPIFEAGGGAINSAITFSRQGLKTATVIKIGRDQAGENILKNLSKERIIAWAARSEKKGTAYSNVLLAPNGERTILVYRGASEDLEISEIPFSKIKARWIYISPGKIHIKTIQKIFNHCVKNKILIAFNPSKHLIETGLKKLQPFLTKSKAIFLNREEAAYLTGIDYQKEKEIFKKLDRVVPGIIVMTDGSRGVLASDGLRIYQAHAFKPQKVVDETGAGDAFASGFVAGLIHKKEDCAKGLCEVDNIKYAVCLGLANSASVVEHTGAQEGIISRKEFEKSPRWRKLEIKIVPS